jgi:hypothetical protein
MDPELQSPMTPENATAIKANLPDSACYSIRVNADWVQVEMYREHDCLPEKVELWTDRAGYADIEIWKTSYKQPAKVRVLSWYGVRVPGRGLCTIPLGANLIGGRMLHLYTIVKFKGLVYRPGPSQSGQWTSTDGIHWTAFTRGRLGVKLYARLHGTEGGANGEDS